MVALNFDVFWKDRGAAAGLQKLAQQADKSHTSVNKLATGTAKFSGLGALAFKAAGAAAVGFGLKVASGNEQAKISFTTMLGSAQKADIFLKQLQRFAATTPFEFPELQKAASSLISVGVSADKVIPIMKTLGNVTSGMGTGAEGVQRATVALQQMQAAGRITAEDLNQLRDAGLPLNAIFDAMAQKTGKTSKQIAEMARTGKLGKQELEALMSSLESGRGFEKFDGLMEKQSKSLAGMVSTLKDDLGQGLANFLTPLFPAMKASIGAFNDMGSGAKATFAIIAAGTVTMGLGAKGVMKLHGAFLDLGLSAKSAAGGVGAAKIATTGVAAALTVATLAFGLYASSHAKAKARVEEFTQALQGETDAVHENVRVVAAKQLQDAGAFKAAEQLGLGLDVVTQAALGNADAIAQVNAVTDEAIRLGLDSADVDANIRVGAANDLSRAVGITGGAYNKAMTEAKQMDAATGGAAGAMDNMKTKTVSAKDALKQWREEMFKSARAAMGLIGTQIDYEQAVDDATQSVKDNGKTHDVSTEKGRNNRRALINLANSSLAYREKLIEQKASTKKVDEATESSRKTFIKTAIKMDYTRKEAEDLADKFGLLDRKIKGVDGKTVKIKFKSDTSWKDSSGVKWSVNLTSPSSVGRKAVGGLIRGGGTGTSDSIPTLLSDGEFVVNAKQTKRHRTALEAINSGRGMAKGGYLDVNLGREGLGPASRAPGNIARLRDTYAKNFGDRIGKEMAKWIEPALMGPGGSVAGYSAGQAATIARLRAAGARSFTTYPGHHPSMARARDVTPHNWKLANIARASSGVWYVIYQMKIASKNHGNSWRTYHPSNFRGDWQHRRHIHVAWFDRGGMLRPGLNLAYNGTGKNEHLRPSGNGNATTVVNQYITLPNYVGSHGDMVNALVTLKRQGRLDVVLR